MGLPAASRQEGTLPEPITARCPSCGKIARMTPIVFGYPGVELWTAERRGEVVLGGCVVGPTDPTHRCVACNTSVQLPEGADGTALA